MAGKQNRQQTTETLLYVDHCIGVKQTDQLSFKKMQIRNTLLTICAVLIIMLSLVIGVIAATVVVLRTTLINERCNQSELIGLHTEDVEPTKLPQFRLKNVHLPETAFHYDSFRNWTIISTEHLVDNQDVVEVVQVDVSKQVKITTIAGHDGNISATVIEDTMKRFVVFKDHLTKTCLVLPLSQLSSSTKTEHNVMESEGIIQAQVEIESQHLHREFGLTIAERCIDSRNFRAILITPASGRQPRRVWNGDDDFNHVVGGRRHTLIRILCCRCITSPCPCEMIPCPQRKPSAT